MKVFTTGQVAKICKVAPRTVSKWFDSGRLKGYRIPGSHIAVFRAITSSSSSKSMVCPWVILKMKPWPRS